MLNYNNIVIKSVRTDTYYYDHKKNKSIDYKKPKITIKILHEAKCCYDLGELYEVIKFHTDKQGQYGNEIKVSFDTNIEY